MNPPEIDFGDIVSPDILMHFYTAHCEAVEAGVPVDCPPYEALYRVARQNSKRNLDSCTKRMLDTDVMGLTAPQKRMVLAMLDRSFLMGAHTASIVQKPWPDYVYNAFQHSSSLGEVTFNPRVGVEVSCPVCGRKEVSALMKRKLPELNEVGYVEQSCPICHEGEMKSEFFPTKTRYWDVHGRIISDKKAAKMGLKG